MTFHFITLFPEAVEPYLHASILGRAEKKKLLKFKLVHLRKFGKGRHRQVDDRAYGGGPGMVLQVEPIARAVRNIEAGIRNKELRRKTRGRTRIILFSTRGKLFSEKEAKRLSKYDHLVFICGRYEGVDERVAKHIADEEISIGDFILSGGELPALIVTDAVSRLIPGVLGKTESLEDIKGSYPVYSKPEAFERHNVPKILLSGNHKDIQEWRKGYGNPKPR